MIKQFEKVWTVVNELKDGTSEIVGVYSDIGEAMSQSFDQKNDSINKNYIHEHKMLVNSGSTLTLQELIDLFDLVGDRLC